MSPALEEYADYLERYADFLEDMADDAGGEYDALVSFNAEELTHAMAALQSGMMQLEQMEEKRMELQRRAGFGDKTFAEILKELPAADRGELEEVFRRTRVAVWDIKFLNEKALAFAKEGVKAMRSEKFDPQHNLYTPPAKGGAKHGAEGAAVFEANY